MIFPWNRLNKKTLSFCVSSLGDNDLAKDDFIKFHEDPRYEADFEGAGIAVKQFWCEQISNYANLVMRAMDVMVPFTTLVSLPL